jgi:uncharacterized membrane protein (DUF106 family)
MKKRYILLALLASMIIALSWQSVPSVSNTAHAILDPTLGRLLGFNVFFGMAIIVGILSLMMSLIQKYTTDQESLRQMRKDQKELQAQMKQHRDNPEKLKEINAKQLEYMSRSMRQSMNSFVYTAVPLILLFRWFGDYFTVVSYKFFGSLSWFWFYLIASVAFSMLWRKVLKVTY